MKKILFVTGTRADFGKVKPLIERIQESDSVEGYIFATGMHSLARYGSTFHEIEKSGLKNIFLYMNQMAGTSGAMDMTLAQTILGLGHYVQEFRPDMIVVHGDRVETLAGAIVGTLNNILVSHIEGGELSGTIDELIRHSVSKLAHIHFVANEEAKGRLIQMGEKSDTIYVIGSPDIDVMLSDHLPDIVDVKEYYEITFDNYFILIYHPVTTDLENLYHRTKAVMNILKSSENKYVVIYPNNDKGSDIIIEAIKGHENRDNVRVFASLRFENFLSLLRNTKAIVGNSSAGIREAPIYGVPTVNIGNRQHNRFNYESIINVTENTAEILGVLEQLPKIVHPSHHFGNGRSAELFYSCIDNSEFWLTPLQKQFQELNLSNNMN